MTDEEFRRTVAPSGADAATGVAAEATPTVRCHAMAWTNEEEYKVLVTRSRCRHDRCDLAEGRAALCADGHCSKEALHGALVDSAGVPGDAARSEAQD